MNVIREEVEHPYTIHEDAQETKPDVKGGLPTLSATERDVDIQRKESRGDEPADIENDMESLEKADVSNNTINDLCDANADSSGETRDDVDKEQDKASQELDTVEEGSKVSDTTKKSEHPSFKSPLMSKEENEALKEESKENETVTKDKKDKSTPVMNNLGRLPTQYTCPHCGHTEETVVSNRSNFITFTFMIIIGWIFWPLFWVPFVIQVCKVTKHKCGYCGAKVGETKALDEYCA